MSDTASISFTPARRRRKAQSELPELLVNAESAPEVPAEMLLERLGEGAKYCRQVEEQLLKHAGPELDTIMRLHRLIILKLSTRAEAQPELWDVLKDLMKPVMDWARLQESRKEREFAEQKYRDQVEAEQREENKRPEDSALSPKTLENIEFELKLL